VDRRAAIDIVGFSELTDAPRARLPADDEECARFGIDETTDSCGAAMERAYERTGLLPSRFLPLFVAFRDPSPFASSCTVSLRRTDR